MNYGCDSAHVFHVSKAGNDANGGLAQQYPIALAADSKLTIAGAVAVAADGDTIIIWPGTYTEQVDLLTATKAINLIGTSREKCIITQATTSKTILTYAGTVLKNLTITQTGTVMVVDSGSQNQCQFINCSILGGDGTIDGLYCASAKRIIVRDCYLKSGYDTLYIGSGGIVESCIIVTNGLSSGSGIARAVALGGTSENCVIRNSIIIAQPSYEKATGKTPELYQSERDLYCISGGVVVLENCILFADGSYPSGAHASSYSNGNSICLSGQYTLVAKNCILRAYTDLNVADRIAYGITTVNSISLINCIIETLAVGSGGSAYDIYHGSASTVCLMATRYDPTKVHANVTLKSDPRAVLNTAIPASPVADSPFAILKSNNQAAKTLLNKAIQTKATGAIDYYDDDGETKILTHTPTDGESTITRTPS